ncbi:MAG: RidA family protein [Granulosicoccaceae bacterium]
MALIKSGERVRSSNHVIHNDTGYFVKIPPNPDEDFEAQIRATLTSLDDEMEQAGTHRANMLMVHIYLADIDRVAEFNGHWDTWLDGAKPPMRACVQPAKLANPKYMLELVVTAAMTS